MNIGIINIIGEKDKEDLIHFLDSRNYNWHESYIQTPSPTGDRDCEELKKEIDRLKEIHSDWLKASAETYELQHKTEISAFQNRISELESLLEIERKGRGTNEGYF